MYRTCTNNNSKDNLDIFCEEFEEYLLKVSGKPGILLICGDLNFHFENPELPTVHRINTLLSNMRFLQHVTEATHLEKGILDAVISMNSTTEENNLKSLQMKT